MNSLDPQKNNVLEDGQVYAVVRYDDIVKERFYITKATNVSYEDTGKMTPKERHLYIDYINEDIRAQKEALEKIKSQNT